MSLFGQPAQSSAFGAGPSASQGLFGASPFGAASSQSLFGSSAAAQSPGTLFSSTPTTAGLFGASTPSTGGLFGAPASTGGLFGAANTGGGLFGSAPSSGGSLFGGTASTGGGLFGAASSAGGGLFGPLASSGSLFGTPSTGGGLFGTPANTGGGLFGAAGTPNTGGGLFGAQPASGGGLFGAPASPVQTGALVPAAPGTPTPAAASGAVVQAAAQAQQLSQEQQALLRDLHRLHTAFTAGQNGYKFCKLLLYVVDPNAYRQRPPDISEAEWQHALRKAGGPNNPDGLWPVAVHGFSQLKAHKESQDAAVSENRGYLGELRATTQSICATQEQELRQRAQRILSTHTTLAHRLLQVLRYVDALEAHYSNALHSPSLRATMTQLSEQLDRIAAELAPNHIKGLKHRAEAVIAAVELQADGGASASAAPDWIDADSLRNASVLVAEHTAGLQELQKHLRTMLRDMAILTSADNDTDVMVQTT